MRQLIESENFKLDPFFNLSTDNLCITDFEGYFKKVNPAFTKLLGYTDKELYSKPITEFIYEEDRELTARHGQNLINNIPLCNFENRYVSKTGELVWLYWTATPSVDEGLVYAIAKDITHKKELENERISLVSDLVETNEKLKQLNHITSHDLRSPVNNLVYLVEMLDTNKINDDTTLQILEHVKRSADGLKESLNAYVDAVTESESVAEALDDVYFNEVFQEVTQSIGTLLSGSNVEFITDFSEAQFVPFNREYMKSIFLNLISNSTKYARPGVAPIISIKTQMDRGRKKLIYSDNGLGFDMEKYGHLIFELSQKFHDANGSKGLGLYLVKKHITSLGGSIQVDSKINQGTTFTFVFEEWS
ncbi:PAS domain-containing sensor histidine kinase [Zobellia sp. B3R18]|uniref:PAS domain-containing sensor histidine kinase n=1 Tax=Zobellia sp. B3R18 TaxID=2841568 RepID=UPI001C073AA9|nr:PAS domain-containing sensor histidine kinase [Zobellia sp. B3R18]MBU2974142.1 PAS domain-containing sensor histidine kinase [Zobellia sp. B3R18]